MLVDRSVLSVSCEYLQGLLNKLNPVKCLHCEKVITNEEYMTNVFGFNWCNDCHELVEAELN